MDPPKRQIYSPVHGDETLKCLALYIGRVWREDDGISGHVMDLLAEWVEQYEHYWIQVSQDAEILDKQMEHARRTVQRLLGDSDE
ncbi:MAG: hypothetical protein KJN79_00135 [Gammaproteobacteria bacterium]|nr:hypothetical protein [Gammaproteobacteria bacterium]